MNYDHRFGKDFHRMDKDIVHVLTSVEYEIEANKKAIEELTERSGQFIRFTETERQLILKMFEHKNKVAEALVKAFKDKDAEAFEAAEQKLLNLKIGE